MRISSRKRTPARRGIFLMEVLVYGILFSAVAVVVGDLVVLLMKTTAETRERDTMIARVDSALDVLRRDAWRAESFRPDGDSVEMTLPGGGTVSWRGGLGGLARVAEGEPARAWVKMPPVQFSAAAPSAGGVLVMQVDSGPGGLARKEEIRFVSQRMLAGGSK